MAIACRRDRYRIMKKRKEQAKLMKSSSSSSSKRKTSPENKQQQTTTNIGCMSSIFNLVSKYHKRRKFLTSGEKKDSNVISSEVRKTAAATLSFDSELVRLSCDVKRSPTIASDIRRLELNNAADVVAQIVRKSEMPSLPSSPESVAEKRWKLMESLRKCEEDLNSLKIIIEAVRSSDRHVRSRSCSSMDEKSGGIDMGSEVRKECLMIEVDGGDSAKHDSVSKCEQQPSPVSVLEEVEDISSSPSPVYSRFGSPAANDAGSTDLSFFHKIMLEASPILSNHRENERYNYLSLATTPTKTSFSSPSWSSKAKTQSVDDVFHEAIWEERWELERIGVTLEDHMFGDLIEETVRELGHNYTYSLPFEACRRVLSF